MCKATSLLCIVQSVREQAAVLNSLFGAVAGSAASNSCYPVTGEPVEDHFHVHDIHKARFQ